MNIPSIAEIDISEKRVFIRADLDIPVENTNKALTESKILAIIPTVKYALSQNAKVVIASNLGKPRGRFDKKYSLELVGRILSEILDAEIFFPDNSVGDAVRKIGADMMPGQVMLLENLDFHRGELENSAEFAKNLAECADIYVNEAFSMADMTRASLVSILEYFNEICLGFQFKKEIETLNKIRNPERPFSAILGGGNVMEKVELMESMLDNVDTVMLGGVVANTFLKVLGGQTGKSKIDSEAVYSIKRFLSSAEIRNIKVILPEDYVAIKGNLNNYSGSFIISSGRVPDDLSIVDIGPAAQSDFAKRLTRAKTVLWSGPLGIFEHKEFRKGTEYLAQALAKSDIFSVIIGQDTVGTALELNGKESRSFISRGGQTSIRFISGRKLRVIEAIEERLI